MKKFRFRKPGDLDSEIFRNLNIMAENDPVSSEYRDALTRVRELHDIKALSRKWKVTPDTAVMFLAQLLGIFTIVKHEQFNVITSKALGFVNKGRV